MNHVVHQHQCNCLVEWKDLLLQIDNIKLLILSSTVILIVYAFRKIIFALIKKLFKIKNGDLNGSDFKNKKSLGGKK